MMKEIKEDAILRGEDVAFGGEDDVMGMLDTACPAGTCTDAASATPLAMDLETALKDEEALQQLLSQLLINPTPEAHFEERFISRFHDSVMSQAVTQSPFARLWEQVGLMLASVHKAKLAVTSTLVVGFAAFSLSVSDWVAHSPNPSATASRELVKRSVQASFDSLNASASLPSSITPASDLQIIVAPSMSQQDEDILIENYPFKENHDMAGTDDHCIMLPAM